MDNKDIDKILATAMKDKLNKIINIQDNIVWQKNAIIKQKMVDDLKKEKNELIEMIASSLKQMEEEARRVKQSRKQSVLSNTNPQGNNQIKNLKIMVDESKLDDVLAKHEIKFLSQFEEAGITIEDFDPDIITASKYIKKPKVEMNIEKGEYILKTQNGEKITQKVSAELLTNEAKSKFAEELLKKYSVIAQRRSIEDKIIKRKELENFIAGEKNVEVPQHDVEQYVLRHKDEFMKMLHRDMQIHRKQFELIAEYADINLYNFYYSINPSYAERYIIALDIEDGSFMPTDLEYDKEKVKYVEKPKQEDEKAVDTDKNSSEEQIYDFELPEFEENSAKPKEDIEAIRPDEYLDLNDDNWTLKTSIPEKEDKPKQVRIRREALYSSKHKKTIAKKAKEHLKLGIASIKKKDRGFKKFWNGIAKKLGLIKPTLALNEGNSESEVADSIYKMDNSFKEGLSEKVEPIDIKEFEAKSEQARKNSPKKQIQI